MGFPYWSTVFVLSNAAYLFSTYLDYRQRKALKNSQRPKPLAQVCSQEDFDKSRAYGLDKSTFGFISGLFSQFQSNVILYFHLYAFIWYLSGNFLAYVYADYSASNAADYEKVQSLVFSGILFMVSLVLEMPFSLYSTFKIEKKHGFNQQTIGLYFMDLVKTILLTVVIGGPILYCLLWTIEAAGERFYFYVWIFLAVVQLFIITIFPTVIQPLFNKFEILPEGDLKSKIEDLASSVAFPLTKIYVMDGSKRSSHSNAYFFGLFKNKRIVLFDTLLKQMDNDEICAVLAHELGHWKKNHMIRRLIVMQIHILFIFYTFSFVIHQKDLYVEFGFFDSMPVIIGLMMFQSLLTPLEIILGFLVSWQSRSHEFEADHYAHNLGYNDLLQTGLIKLYAENKSFIHPDWLYSIMHYSHPPPTERLEVLKSLEKKSQ